MIIKKLHDYLQSEIHKSIFFFVLCNLLDNTKSLLQKCKIYKKLESITKKEKMVHKLQLLLKCLVHLDVLMFEAIYQHNNYIGLKVIKGKFHLKLLRLLVIKKVISNLFLSFYLIYYKIFKLINNFVFGVFFIR